MRKDAVLERMNAHINKDCRDGCWIWTACVTHNGYGVLKVDGRGRRAHRIMWEIVNGPIPDGMCVLHKCDNPSCVNPAHLFVGTTADNNRDAQQKGRIARGERQHIAKLDADDVRSIRRLHPGISIRRLAIQYGVAKRTIRHVINLTTWRHIR